MMTISQAEKDRFAALYADNATYKGLAEIFKRSPETMRQWRRRFGLPRRPRKGPTKNLVYVGFHCDEEINRKLVYVARRAGLTRAEFMRRLLERKLRGVKINGTR